MYPLISHSFFCKFTHFWVIILIYSDIFPPKIPTVNPTELPLGLKHTRSTVFNLITRFLFGYKLQIVSFFLHVIKLCINVYFIKYKIELKAIKGQDKLRLLVVKISTSKISRQMESYIDVGDKSETLSRSKSHQHIAKILKCWWRFWPFK